MANGCDDDFGQGDYAWTMSSVISAIIVWTASGSTGLASRLTPRATFEAAGSPFVLRPGSLLRLKTGDADLIKRGHLAGAGQVSGELRLLRGPGGYVGSENAQPGRRPGPRHSTSWTG